jgi:calcineurin-like phosphoesterase family protein
MANEPQTFRDHALSLLQSAAAEAGRETGGVGLTIPPSVENDLVRATAQIGALRMQGAAIPLTAPAGVLQTTWDCAKLGFDLLHAKIAGDTAEVQKLQGELDFSTCDKNWARALTSYLGYYGPDGKLRTIPYIRAGQVGAKVIPLRAGARVALIADWGTGTDVAVDLLKEVAQQKPDVLIHLGDIYYSGTATECDVNFKRVVDTVLDRAANPIPVFTLSGNHDMYSGGAGFYELIRTLNAPALQQPASFFCLRSTNERWQFVAMDTGKNDYNPFNVTTVLTSLEKDEEDWLVDRIGEFAGKTILLSHHQLFSALSQIGRPRADGSMVAYNPYLAVSFRRFDDAAPGRIASWFWGHEHALSVYQPYLGLARGRCIGHGAVPVFTSGSPDTGLGGIIDPPKLRDDVHLGADGPVYRHGFTMIQLGTDGSATAAYYDSSSGTQPIFTEPL